MTAVQEGTVQSNIRDYSFNRSKCDRAELAKYAGQCVAWSADGKTIIASGKDFVSVARLVQTLGVRPTDVVLESVPPPETVVLL